MREYIRITNSNGETLEFDMGSKLDIEVIRENKGARLKNSYQGTYIKEFENSYGCYSIVQLHSDFIMEDLGKIEDDNEQSDN